MQKRTEEIERILNEISDSVCPLDSLLLVHHDGLENQIRTILLSEDKRNLIASICGCMESNDEMGSDMVDLFSSVIISFAKQNPTFATKFITTFNSVLYGVDFEKF